MNAGAGQPQHPRHPERVCWGCPKYCPADDLACGNEVSRAVHPVEIFGDDWRALEERRENRANRSDREAVKAVQRSGV